MTAPAALPKKYYSVEEYLQLEQQDDMRYEYHNGEVFAMAGGSMNHSNIANNITRCLDDVFTEKDCGAFQEGIKVEVKKNTTYVYPDVVLTCNADDLADGYLIKNPVIVVEVISPSSGSYDRGVKSTWYRRIPSLRYYLLISQTGPLIELYSRSSSTALFQVQDFSSLEDVISFPELNFSLSLQQIYRRVRFENK